MKNKLLSQVLFPALILAVIISIPFIAELQSSPFVLEVTMESSTKGTAQVFYDRGNGLSESESTSVQITVIDSPVTYRFLLPTGDYRGFRFDPNNRESIITFFGVKILDRHGKVIKEIPVSQFKPANQISSWKADDTRVQLTTSPDANDPHLFLELAVALKDSWVRTILDIGLIFLIIFIICSGLLWLASRFFRRFTEQINFGWQKFTEWVNKHPKTSIAGVALLAAVLSCYPVVFLGKSFVSPNHGPYLLYEKYPTLPGYDDLNLEDTMGADAGAMMWEHMPYSVVENQAFFKDYELPLWNRYSLCGSTLLGQGQSMLGDPVHLITILVGGASWAWDIKYMLAKILFTFGLGLLVFSATRHLPSALILAFSSAFICFFAYRFNHPAIFSVCYAPWILYCWLVITQSRAVRTAVWGIAGLVLANWAVMNSGTVKEAYMLIACLNLSGILLLLFSDEAKQLKLTKWLMVFTSGVLFVLISAPVWLTFIDVLHRSYTSYNVPEARQIPSNLFIGFFDDIFYRQLNSGEVHFKPALNFLVLLGFLYSLVRFKELISNRIYLALSISALIPLALVFGAVPARIIVKIPFLGNIGHIDNTFSVVLIIQMVVLAGFGLKSCLERLNQKEWKMDFIVVALMLFALLGLYFGTTQAVHKSRFFYGYAFSLICATLALPLIFRHMYVKGRITLGIMLLLVASLILLHWRHGMYTESLFDKYVMNPQLRANLQPKSPAIEFVKADSNQPYRTVGFGGNLFPGYNCALLIEGICGCDPLINSYYRELNKLIPWGWEWDWRIVISPEKLDEYKKTCDFLNVKYYLASLSDKPKELPGLGFTGRYDLDVYQSDSSWPRAFFSDVISPYQKAQEFVDMVQAGDGQPFAAAQSDVFDNTPVLKDFLGEQNQRKIVPATNYRLTNNTTAFKVVAPSRGIVVLTEAYVDNDFKVTLNGTPACYYRINHVFKGVVVNEAGTYEVSFSYWPRHLTLSLWASGIGLLLLIFWLGYWLYKPVPKGQPFIDKMPT
ncbi:MAG: hypothetical protein V1701_06470 [Planctomycetota bacterium]